MDAISSYKERAMFAADFLGHVGGDLGQTWGFDRICP